MRRILPAVCLAACLMAAALVAAQDLRLPATVAAASELAIPTSGSGNATFYLIGPSSAAKRQVQLGQEIHVQPRELRSAGRYTAILRNGGSTQSGSFYVVAARPASLSFLAHPSRIPVAQRDGVIGVAFVFDKWNNLVRRPETVDFRLAAKDAPAITQSVRSRDGVAWILMNSARKAGNAKFVAALDGIEETRVIQQVAADPCHLQIRAERNAKGVLVQTAPVRDCSGNPVSDGTIVTFTANGPQGVSTVDVPIKKDIAQAELKIPGPATISVASGVVMGNEVKVGGQQ
ncbi:MAG TPA: hypothetical protein VET69_13645 [Terriglobales bacterium]|nr:hypothetical protein [Terriglobales bacterium]